MAGLGFFGLVSVCISSLKRSFFFPLFGIFAMVSDQKPPQHKAGGTLAVILSKKRKNQKKHEESNLHFYII